MPSAVSFGNDALLYFFRQPAECDLVAGVHFKHADDGPSRPTVDAAPPDWKQYAEVNYERISIHPLGSRTKTAGADSHHASRAYSELIGFSRSVRRPLPGAKLFGMLQYRRLALVDEDPGVNYIKIAGVLLPIGLPE